MNKNIINKTVSKIRIVSGVILNSVYQGPYHLYINVTDNCNLNCLMCEAFSPLVERDNIGFRRQVLKKVELDNLIESINKLNIQLVTFTGGGEPFLYPYLMEAIKKLVLSKKDITVVTNGTKIRDEYLETLIKLNVNLRFSILAASGETYTKVHPNQDQDTFRHLNNVLTKLKDLRKVYHSKSVISILFVIFKHNYREIPKMIKMGRDYDVDFVHFKSTIYVQDEMKSLLLDSYDLMDLEKIVNRLKKSKYNFITNIDSIYNDVKYSQNIFNNDCQLNYRRNIPCFKGWTFCWVLANGDVHPCCNCATVSMGNINNDSLEKIWYSKKYVEFRKHTIELKNGFIPIPGCKCETCIPDSEDLKISKIHCLKSKIKKPI